MPPLPRPSINRPPPLGKRAVVIGAGSFGTAVAVLLARGGMRTTLQTRTGEQATRLSERRENEPYLPGVELPRELRIEPVGAGVSRADYVFLGVPSARLDGAIERLERDGLSSRAAVVSLAKGLVPPHGTPPTALLRRRFGPSRTACLGGPAHAGEMVREGAGLVAASTDEGLALALSNVFIRAGVVCERSNDPVGVELAGAAKNAAALASGATEAQGLNAAGAAAGHIFAEVWRWAEAQGARPESMIGLAGTGDLVATALAPESRNRRAGELLAQGAPAIEIPRRIGQAVESLECVPLLAHALNSAGLEAPVSTALADLIEGRLPLDAWVAVVRATVPPPARWRPQVRPGLWLRVRERLRRLFGLSPVARGREPTALGDAPSEPGQADAWTPRADSAAPDQLTAQSGPTPPDAAALTPLDGPAAGPGAVSSNGAGALAGTPVAAPEPGAHQAQHAVPEPQKEG